MRISPAVTALFQQLVDQIEAEVREEFLGRLGVDGAAPKKSGKKPGPKPKAARAKGAKRTPDELEALKTAVFTAVKKNPGSRVEELATIMSLTTKDLALPMLQLRDEKRIVKKGEKRAARYTAK